MKAVFRAALPLVAGLLMLAGCSGALPPNIPRSGTITGTGTPGLIGTPGTPAAPGGQVFTATPAAGYPAPGATAVPAATATTATNGGGSQPTATATTASSTGGTSGATATVAPTIADNGGSGMSNGGLNLSSIALPAQRTPIQFPSGTSSYVVNTTLQNGTPQAYQINAASGQRMFITTDGNTSIQLYDPNLKALSNVLAAVNPVQISLSQAGNHYIALQGNGPVSMSVYIPPSAANQNVAAPIPAQLQPVQFQSGATSASFNANAAAGTPLGYTIQAQAGQQMTVTTNGNATVTLLAPDKVTMVPSANAPVHKWVFPLAKTGSYTMILLGSGPVNVTVSIPAAASGSNGNTGGNPIPSTGEQGTPIPPPPNPTRVTIAPGNSSTTINTNLNAGAPQAYVLRILAGQTLFVSTSGPAGVTIYGPGNVMLFNGSAGFPNRWQASAGQDGDYTFVITGSGPQALEFYVPPQ